MPYLISNAPNFKCWVRKEFTCNHQDYHGEYLHAMAFAVNTIPDRSLSFHIVFTGCEVDQEDGPEENVHGGAMWARMPYLFTVDYTDSEIADDPAQHKQSHVLYLTEGQWKGNLIALPNNRVRATSPALWRTGEGAPDFTPSQWTHSAEAHESYLDASVTFDNLYNEND